MNTPTNGAASAAPLAGLPAFPLKPVPLLALALLASFILYALNAGDFFFHDSAPVLEENSAIRISGSRLEDWRTAAMSTNTGPLGRPISMLSFAANHVLAGDVSAVQVKLTNVILHGLTGLFLWCFLAVVLERSPMLVLDRERARLIASVAAAIWLLHPLHVSTVLYAVQRMTQLPALFTFIGLWHIFLLRSRWLEERPTASDYSRVLLVGLVWTAFAAYSKENGLLLPLLAAVTELCLFRFRIAGGESPLVRWIVLAALAGTVLVLVALPLLAPDWIQGWYAQRPFTLGERLLTQGRMLWQYLGWLFLPDITVMGFNHDDIPISRGFLAPWTSLLSILAFAALGALCWWLRDRVPLLGFAFLWYLFGHLLESSIFALEMSYEHRNYLPAAGPFLLLAAVPLQLAGKRAGIARLGLGLFVAALVPLLFLRGAVWSTELGLVETNYRNHPESAKTRFNLASVYYQEALATEDRELRQQYFAASRLAALKLVEAEAGNIPALVWLILIDSSSSDTSRVVEWQQRLAAALEKPVLHASDIKFIMLLNDCVMLERCPEPVGGHEAFLRTVFENHNQRPHLLYELARYCRYTGRYDCAREEAETLLSKDPRFLRGLEILFLIEREQGNHGRAQETARRLLLADKRRRFTSGMVKSREAGPDAG